MTRTALALLAWAACLALTSAALERNVLYITNWSQYGPGDCKWVPRLLPAGVVKRASHIVYAFAKMGPGHSLARTDESDDTLYRQKQDLRRHNKKLKTLIAVGGWTHNDPNQTTLHLFSYAVGSRANRTRFISNILTFTARNGFDGIDFDWEYPATADRGGRWADTAGLTALVAELRAAATAAGRKSFLISMATGAGAYGYSGLDLPGLLPNVNFFNLMTYDYHGPWEEVVNLQTPWSDAQGGEDIRGTLRHYIQDSGVPPAKLNLGLAVYGHTWTLASPAHAVPGATGFNTSAPGRCTGETGFLSWREVKEIITGGAKVTMDPVAKAAYLVKGSQWVSFDLPQTIYMKMQAAQAMGLGGTMVWAADLDDADYSMLKLIGGRGPDPGPYRPVPARPPPPRG